MFWDVVMKGFMGGFFFLPIVLRAVYLEFVLIHFF